MKPSLRSVAMLATVLGIAMSSTDNIVDSAPVKPKAPVPTSIQNSKKKKAADKRARKNAQRLAQSRGVRDGHDG